VKLERKKAQAPYVPTASFGDIAFLLIIFFMVASVFMKEAHIEAKDARSPDVDKIEAPNISVVLDTKGELWLQGEKCTFDALEPSVAALLGDRADRTVAVRIDKDQLQKDYGRVLLGLSGAGADIVMLGQKEAR
jgi:biopolymer transport protein ExbD